VGLRAVCVASLSVAAGRLSVIDVAGAMAVVASVTVVDVAAFVVLLLSASTN
jgi:hypothetical protein